jgi:hypothetical protein
MPKLNLEQPCAIKFHENATENYKKLKRVYGKHAASRAQGFRWQKAILIAVRMWKTNLVLEDFSCQKRKKM